MVHLPPADLSDSAAAQLIVAALRQRWPWLKHLFRDAAYDRGRLLDKAAFLDFTVEVVGHSVSHLIRWRRLVRDYETRLDVSEAMIYGALSSNLMRRLAT